MNRVCLVGRLTAKPELRYTGGNLAYTRFSIAVNRPFSTNQGQGPTADFINIVVWRKQAENVCNFLNKGSQVSIEGRIQTSNYTDQTGNKRYTTEVLADSVQFLESKTQSQNRQTEGGTPENVPTPYDYQDSTPTNDMNIENDPFSDFGDSVSIDDNFLD